MAASTAKVVRNPAAASRNPHRVVPTIWPKLVTAFRRPSCTPRAPGSSLAIAQVAGQNAARASTNTIWPTSSIQKPWANMNHTPAAMVATHEPTRMRRPPMRSVYAPPMRLSGAWASTGTANRIPISALDSPCE